MSAEAKQKNKFFGPVVFILLGGLVGVAGYWLGKSGLPVADHAVSPSLKAPLLFFLIPSVFLVIAVHEAGHAFAGTWVNFDFRLYVVGPFMWDKESGEWKFKWNKNINTAGGLVICLPKGKENLNNRFLWYAAGGPIASIALALIAYAVYMILTFNKGNSAGVQIVAYGCAITAFFSLAIFIATAIPMQFGGFASDGARVFRLIRGGDAARFETLIIKIIADTTGGIRPAQLELRELQEADEIARRINAPFGIYILSYLHQYYFDRAELDKAEYYLQEYMGRAAQIPEGFRSSVWLDVAFFYAYGKHNLDTALMYWDKYTPSAIIPKAQIYATEAAISYLKNEKERTINEAELAMKELPNMMDKGAAIVLKERLNQLLANIND